MVAKKRKDQSGQALIELIIFLPLMFALYSLISGFANAINGSINQQKITRGYFYFRAQNNSMLPKPIYPVGSDPSESWRKFGMYFIGWTDISVDDSRPTPYMPCYKISLPMAGKTTGEKCEDSYSKETTQFIRVGTAYGICGATFSKISDSTFLIPDALGSDFSELVDVESCLISR